ncbi:MAG: hypothetical protein OEY34_04475 [Cyclobacteriaceae bacterium]|nr:hypothetical protein [Cyclobacteriaceae bacterium]
MYKVRNIFVILIVLFSLPVLAQDVDGNTTNQKALLMKAMDEGVILMDAGNYEEADGKFRYVLENLEVLPSNMAYFVGKNSYHLNKLKQSINWLNKYIELKGTSGQYYNEAVEYLNRAQKKLIEDSEPEKTDSSLIDEDGYRNIDCGPSGKVICPVCKGKTVIIKSTPIGTTYNPCPYSDSHGLLTCEEYNLLLKGELKRKF